MISTGNALRRARKNAGVRVYDVAFRLGISTAAVYQWETDMTKPETDKLLTLATMYHTTVDELLGKEG